MRADSRRQAVERGRQSGVTITSERIALLNHAPELADNRPTVSSRDFPLLGKPCDERPRDTAHTRDHRIAADDGGQPFNFVWILMHHPVCLL